MGANVSASLIGQTLGNKYKIVQLLGKGGMATVYKGYQEQIDRYVAIKVLPPHPGQDAEFAQRFLLEARTVARLQHPHILPVYDYGTEGDVAYLATAYIEGGALGDRIDSGPMPLSTVETYLREIASALDYAHRQGIVHRDVKPDNILINSEGYSLLGDFGIVKLLSSDSNLTATGGLIGTPAYMAPEQAQGGEVGPASDIYSLGVVVYEMITGRQPYTADTPLHVMMKHITDPVPHISEVVTDVPLAVENVLLRALAKQPEDRYPTAAAFAEDFSRAISGQRIQSPPLTSPGTSLKDTAVLTEASETLHLPGTDATAAGSTQTAVRERQPQSGNTLLILGGFTIIALFIVAVVALFVFSLNNNPTPDPATDPTAAATATPAESIVQVPPTAVAAQSFGRVSFGTASTMGDTLTLQASDLPSLGAGQSYVAWLQNTGTDDALRVGALPINALGSGTLTYTDAEGRFLPGLFNAVIITREAEAADTPSDEVVYTGSYPVEIAQALTAILVDSGDGTGLAQGALSEADFARQHANLAAQSSNVAGVRLHVEHTINILLGTEDDYNGNDRGENPSPQKLGVGHFLDQIEAQLDEAVAADNVPVAVQNEAELMRVCVINARLFTDNMLTIQNAVLAGEEMSAIEDDLAESVQQADILIEGTDFDGNGRVDPFEGECSLRQIETFGVLAAVIELHESAGADA